MDADGLLVKDLIAGWDFPALQLVFRLSSHGSLALFHTTNSILIPLDLSLICSLNRPSIQPLFAVLTGDIDRLLLVQLLVFLGCVSLYPSHCVKPCELCHA